MTDMRVEDTSTVDVGSQDTLPPEDIAPPLCEEGSGCFGEPCEEGGDCLSDICTLHMGERVCSKTCDVTCPDGWSCNLVTSGGDSQYVCVSNASHLCLPCSTSGDCSSDATVSACVRYASGDSFCGSGCGVDSPCPQGYGCQEVETVDGATSFQCVSESGTCECTSLAVASALSTPCTNDNEFGSCAGVRVCGDEGLEACDANTPAVEVATVSTMTATDCSMREPAMMETPARKTPA